MKKICAFIAVLFFVTASVGFAQGKYDELMEYNEQFIQMTQSYIDSINTAESSDAVAKAMNQYTRTFSQIVPKMKALTKKYPELLTETDLPEKVRISQEKAEKLGSDLAASFMKAMQYMDDPKVVQAQEEMSEMMESLEQ